MPFFSETQHQYLCGKQFRIEVFYKQLKKATSLQVKIITMTPIANLLDF